MISPAIQHTFSCYYREFGTSETTFDMYFDRSVFKVSSDVCTHYQANIGMVYTGVVIGLIAFCVFAILDGGNVQRLAARNDTNSIVGEFLLSLVLATLTGLFGAFAMTAIIVAWAPLLGLVGFVLGLYGLYRLLAGWDFVGAIKSIASKFSLNAHLKRKQQRLEVELEKLRTDPLYLEAERRLEAELATDSLASEINKLIV